MDQKVMDILSKPVKVAYKPGPGGMKYKYVPGDDVINRLNEAFNYDWSSTVLETKRDDNQIIIHVRLTVGNISKEGFGGAEIAVYKNGDKAGKPIDISNAYKSALTNAIKKASEQFGIGLTHDDADVIEDNSGNNGNPYNNRNNTPTNNAKPVSSTIPVSTSTSVKTTAPQVGTAASGINLEELARAVEQQLKGGTVNLAKDAPKEPLPNNVVQFPKSGNDSDKATDVQVQAISGLSKMKKISEVETITKALPGTNKSSFKELSMGEARTIIAFLQTSRA